MKALKIQGKSRDDLPYKAPFQPYGSWFALIATGIILFFKGFDSFLPFDKANFITNYIAIPIFFIFWIGYKLFYRTKVIPLVRVDVDTGRKEILEEEERFRELEALKGPKTRWQKILSEF